LKDQLEGSGGLYSGSARAIKHIIKVSFDMLNVSFKKSFFLKLQWILLVFAFWPHQKTGFEASERSKETSHAPTAHKLTLDILHTIRVAAFLACASLNRFLKTKRREEERGERKEKEGRGERGEREKRRQQTAPPEWLQGLGRFFLFPSHDPPT
jgi:hypothetical protein